ncbi:MAG: metalloregulator ArsR/SmtB family transcription factor [Ignavibacteria bacterium]|nr:metalloregulator ArsR/SmtB family transcription factor [Ignavibacteria bacterium]
MGLKTTFSDEQLKQLSEIFKILSEISRLKILRCLMDGEKCVTEIINATGLMQANVSKQIKLMQNAGILECRPSGLQRFYRIVNPSIIEICNLICKNRN